jgi:hypothetical protein
MFKALVCFALLSIAFSAVFAAPVELTLENFDESIKEGNWFVKL